MPASRALRMTSTAVRTGSRSWPRTPVPSSASTTIAARSMPWPRIATSRATPAWIFVIPSIPSSRCQLRSASGVRGRSPVATRTAIDGHAPLREPARRHEAVAAVVPGTPEHQDGPALAPVEREQRASGRGDRGAGVLHELLARDPERLRLEVGAGHRLGGHRCATSRPRPALLELVEGERGEVRVVGRQWEANPGTP